MKCQACGADGAQHELIEIIDGHAQTMHFCAHCLPERVRGMAASSPVLFSAVQKRGDDLHLWLTVFGDAADSKAILRLADDVEISFPVEDGDEFAFDGKAAAFRPDCDGDLVVHISVQEDYYKL